MVINCNILEIVNEKINYIISVQVDYDIIQLFDNTNSWNKFKNVLSWNNCSENKYKIN